MKLKNYSLLLILALLWGPSFLLIKFALIDFSPLMLAALRISLAAVFINLLLIFKSQKLTSSLSFWKHALITGFFAHTVPFLLINWGEQHIDTGIASIINGLTPLSTLLLAHFSIKGEQLNINKSVGVAIGFLGLLVLMLPQLSLGTDYGIIGVLAVTIGAISYGVAIVYARKHLRSAPAMHAPSAQLLITSAYMVPIAFFLDGGDSLISASLMSWSSVLLLSFFGTAVAFIIYYRLLADTSATFLSLVTYILPVFGVLLGVLFLDEQLHVEVLIGMLLIIVGILVSNSSYLPYLANLKTRKM